MSSLPPIPPPQGRRLYLGEPPPVDTAPDPDPPPTGMPFFPAIACDEGMDTWSLRYDGEWAYINLPHEPLPEGTFTLITTVTTLPDDPAAGVGLFIYNEEDGPVYLLASRGGDGKVPVHLMIVWGVAGQAHCYKSDDGLSWDPVQAGPFKRPTTGGLVLRYGPSGTPVSGQAARFRVLDGVLDVAAHVEVGI